MSTVIRPQTAADVGDSLQLNIMTDMDLMEVVSIENTIYPTPWTHGNFLDSLRSGYPCRVLRDAYGNLIGYFLMMLLVDEAHLLNISIRADLHGTGLGRYLLDQVAQLANNELMSSILLEVRPSNPRALAVYERYGFVRIGLRKNYYPAVAGQREDAIVMRLVL
jgi:ribosomal-protein-alanine N-acetyltransferase